MEEIIRIESVPARLGANFAEVRDRLATELERYDVLVTVETLPGAKKLATELNQMAKSIDDRRKEAVAAVSEPIREFDDQMKDLVTMCKDGRQKLLEQIKHYEDETREKARELLSEALEQAWFEKGVDPEFRKATIDGLVMLTAITKTGALTAKSLDAIRQRVNDDRSLQDRTNMRLLELENASYKAGLSAPLTRDHVAGFLMADDTTYQAELKRIIDAEILREQEAQRRMREKLEREQEAMMNAGMRSHEGMSNAGMQISEGMANSEEAKRWNSQGDAPQLETEADTAPGKVRVIVTATFAPEVPATASDDAIMAALTHTMEAAGIKTLTNITVRRENQYQ